MRTRTKKLFVATIIIWMLNKLSHVNNVRLKNNLPINSMSKWD